MFKKAVDSDRKIKQLRRMARQNERLDMEVRSGLKQFRIPEIRLTDKMIAEREEMERQALISEAAVIEEDVGDDIESSSDRSDDEVAAGDDIEFVDDE